MPTWLQGLITDHTVTVGIAAFTFISLVLTGIANYLQSIGDKVPGLLGTLSSGLASVIKFLNGLHSG